VLASRRAPSWLRPTLVFALALLTRLAFVAWARGRFPPADDGHYYDVLARRLAAGAGYTWAWPDGAVTPAAHYPVGYPALLALAYAASGGSIAAAMVVNALIGAAGACATAALVDEKGGPAWRPLAAGLAVGLHPALVPYTAALMTEAVTASILAIAGALAVRGRRARRDGPWVVAVGLTMAVATLVRPQTLLLAPVIGALVAGETVSLRGRLRRAAAVSAIALACVAPWTARNCVRMHRCALVSVNGGWNLLIGAQTTSGAWEPVSVPPDCRTVWDEAGKDTCFERAARRVIAAHPGRWLSRVPAKLAATFDYFGAAPSYLSTSNAAAFDDRAKLGLGAAETIVCRLLLLAALVACGRREGPRLVSRKIMALAGAVAALTVHGWIGYVALAGCVALLGSRCLASGPAALPIAGAVAAVTAAVHAVFFGAGRYGLLVVPFVSAAAFVARRAPRGGCAAGARDAQSSPSTPLGRSPVTADDVRVAAPCCHGRKVRAPQSTMPGNARWRKRRGECHREETAGLRLRADAGKGETAG
jgi:hypothetical protein